MFAREREKPLIIRIDTNGFFNLMASVLGQDNVIGVWSNELIPKGTRFGPMVAQVFKADDYLPKNRKYFWTVFNKYRDNILFYLDGHDTTRANWMRHVLPAVNSAEQNLVAFQVERHVKIFDSNHPFFMGPVFLSFYRMGQRFILSP